MPPRKKQSAEDKQKTGKQWEETFKVNGEELIKKVKDLIKEGNVRKLIIKGSKGQTIIEFPLTVGVVITVLAPVLAAVGAIAALISECTITVVREK
jgi:hypothetical protein